MKSVSINIILLLTIFVICPRIVVSQLEEKKPAPTVILKDLSGKTLKLSDLKGKVVLLNFWATWCVPCGAEVPELVKWQTQYKSSGLKIIGVTYPPTNLAAVRHFVRAKNINYPILLGTKKTKSLFDSTENLPMSIIIDKQGNIAGKIGGVIFQDEFGTYLRPLLEP